MYLIQVEIGAFFSKHSQLIRHIWHNMAIEFIKVVLTDNLGSPWNISQTKIAPYAACMVKIGIQMNNAVYTSKDKNYLFSSIKKNFCYKT